MQKYLANLKLQNTFCGLINKLYRVAHRKHVKIQKNVRNPIILLSEEHFQILIPLV